MWAQKDNFTQGEIWVRFDPLEVGLNIQKLRKTE